MNKLRVLLVAAALLTAACGTATISGSQVKSVTNSSDVRVDAGTNADTDVSGGAEVSDLGRGNPTASKASGGPVPVQRSHPPAPNGTEPSTSGHDRCTNGIGANSGFTPMTGKQPPLPECAVE